MEPKKIKKLVIKQEVISNLNENALSKIKGGTDWFSYQYPCMTDTCPTDDSCPQLGSDCCGSYPCTSDPCGNSGGNNGISGNEWCMSLPFNSCYC